MSAYIVDKRVIGYLIGCDLLMERCQGCILRKQSPVDTGRMLWEENYKSVRHCYSPLPEDELPGDIRGFQAGFNEEDILRLSREQFDPVQLLKTIACLEYQSCEHPGWEDSKSCKFLAGLQRRAIRALSGWDYAAWGAPKEDNPKKLKHYRVTWEIDVQARNAIEAAKEARQAQEPGSTAVYFHCQAPDTLPATVDLMGVLEEAE